MSLDISKLENPQEHDGKTTARCPACAEEGHDNKGDHLVIYPSGKFGCVAYPGPNGADHRSRIQQLAGDTSPNSQSKPIARIPIRVHPDYRKWQATKKNMN